MVVRKGSKISASPLQKIVRLCTNGGFRILFYNVRVRRWNLDLLRAVNIWHLWWDRKSTNDRLLSALWFDITLSKIVTVEFLILTAARVSTSTETAAKLGRPKCFDVACKRTVFCIVLCRIESSTDSGSSLKRVSTETFASRIRVRNVFELCKNVLCREC